MRLFNQILIFLYSFILAILPTSTYVEGVVGQPKSFLPHQAVTQADRTISNLIFRGLFKYDIYGSLIPDLADTWTVSDNGTVYTITLKDKQYWSDGQKITADDLIYTSYKVSDLTGVATDKVNDLTVRYTLPNKFSPFLSLLTIGVMPENVENNYNSLTPLTSGHFKVVRIERSGPIIKQVTLINNDPNDNIRKLIFRYYGNEEELGIAARLGEITGFMSSKDIGLENSEEYKYPIQSVYYALFFNLRNEKFTDTVLRQKLEKVLPVEDMILDKGILVQGPVSRSVFTDRAVESNKYDKNFRDDLNNLPIEITIPDLPAQKDLANRIKKVWSDSLNTDVIIKLIDPSKINDEVIKDRKFEVLLYGQEIGRDPDRYVNWHSTQKDFPGLNLSGFSHVRSDRALEEGRNEPDNDKRIVHYNEFQKVISEQVPAIFLYHPYFKYYVNKKVRGIGEKYTFTLTDRFLDFTNWKMSDE